MLDKPDRQRPPFPPGWQVTGPFQRKPVPIL
jgi:hypothetical protein